MEAALHATGGSFASRTPRPGGDLTRTRVHRLIAELSGGLPSSSRGGAAAGVEAMDGMRALEQAKAEASMAREASRDTFRRCIERAQASKVLRQEQCDEERARRESAPVERMFAMEYHSKWRDAGDHGLVRKGWLQDLRLAPPGPTRSSLHREIWRQRQQASLSQAALRGDLRDPSAAGEPDAGTPDPADARPPPRPAPAPAPAAAATGDVACKPSARRLPGDGPKPPAAARPSPPPEQWGPLDTAGATAGSPRAGRRGPPRREARPPNAQRLELPASPRAGRPQAAPVRQSPLKLPPAPKASARVPAAGAASANAQTPRPMLNEEDRRKVGPGLLPVALPRAGPRIPSPLCAPGVTGVTGSASAREFRPRKVATPRSSAARPAATEREFGSGGDFSVAPVHMPGAAMEAKFDSRMDEWSLVLDAGQLNRIYPSACSGQFEGRTSTPELQAMLQSPAPPLQPRMVEALASHEERKRAARIDRIDVHSAQAHAHDAAQHEAFVRGGPGLEVLPRF